MIRALATALTVSVLATPGFAACKDDVAAAFDKLRKVSSFRIETTMVTEQGPMQMTVDYALPDRMHQKTKVMTTGDESETILVGPKAWSNTKGQGWQPMDEELTAELVKQVKSTVVDAPADIGDFECQGKASLDGRDMQSYKLVDKGDKKTGPMTEAYRLLYVDFITGLPAKNVFVLPGREDKPFFKTTYTFPLDMKIDVPAGAK